MQKIIETMTLSELKLFMKKQGHELTVDEKNGGPRKGGHYLIWFTVSDIICFVYYSEAVSGSESLTITDINFEAFFDHKGVITPEDINHINCQPIEGRLSIQPEGSMTYSLFVSLVGGVTEEHLEHQFKTWLRYMQKCKDFVMASEKGIKQLKIALDNIFKNKTTK